MDTLTRICSTCGNCFSATTEFFFRKYNGKYGLSANCKKCDYARKVEWNKKNPEKLKMLAQRSHKKSKEINPTYQSDYRKRVLREKKEIVFNAYGHKCACCGESTFEFLSIDHIYGNGHDHREKTGRTSSFRTVNMLNSIIKDGFPDSIQILCFNCHFAKDFHGACPHGNIKREYDRWKPKYSIKEIQRKMYSVRKALR